MTSYELYLGRERSIPGLRFLTSGKVRDIYELDPEHLVFVTSDRVSAFDVIMNEGVPWKGAVLTAVAAWWFARTRDVIDNHLVSSSVDDIPGVTDAWRERLRGRVLLVRRAAPTPVEWVVRGYLAGSGWKDYHRSGSVCGVKLPAGLVPYARLPEPILTPTTKEAHHDLPLTAAQAAERVGQAVFDEARAAALALFARGSQVLARLGILLADTKFEFGLRGGRLLLIDEALTPDSSRFWPAEDWQPGRTPHSYDKQILRDWLEAQDWNKQYPPPRVDPDVLDRTGRRYLEFCHKLTGAAPAPFEVAPGR
jgi:phosphoribosylaminoimidazole-succinocarboxamide synthase